MILNKAELVQNGADRLARRARRLLVETLESTLASVDPRVLLSKYVRRRGDSLLIEDRIVHLRNYRAVFVVGAGKASGAMAEALERVLGDRLDGGLVVVPRGQRLPKLDRVKLAIGAHPIPDEDCVQAAREVLAMVESLDRRDLLICVLSGGGSALLSLPAEPLTIEDKAEVTRLVMNSGATIDELNAIRKHLSDIKGGWLAKRSPAGTIVGLVISDVVGDRLDSIASGPISPDPTTFSDAIRILKKYDLLERVPAAAAQILRNGAEGKILETPKAKDPCFRVIRQHILGSNEIACKSAERYLKSKGVTAKVLSSSATGEARYLGTFIGTVARRIATFDDPFMKPAAIVLGGETTVRVTGSGLGGRNQECAMGCAKEIQGLKGLAVASIGTDGIDGPTDAAGAIVDGMTISRSEILGLKFDELLANNDSCQFFSPLKDLVMTGRTDTNVNDITVALLL